MVTLSSIVEIAPFLGGGGGGGGGKVTPWPKGIPITKNLSIKIVGFHGDGLNDQ